jgi:hypothetical protein
LALAPSNDPYYADTPGRREMAEWFAAQWDRFGFGPERYQTDRDAAESAWRALVDDATPRSPKSLTVIAS